MNLHDALSLVIVGMAGFGGLVVMVAIGWVALKSGTAKGWRESAEGWEARANELMRTVAEKDQTAAALAEHHHTEITQLRNELAAARERIAVLETLTDLTPIREALVDHEERALERSERFLEAVEKLRASIPNNITPEAA